MKKLMQTLMIFIVATLTLLTVAAWGQVAPVDKKAPTAKVITLQVTVAELFDYEEYGSNDVPMDFVIGELKSARGLTKAEIKEIKALAQNGFVLMHQQNVNACADGYLVMDLNKTFDNAAPYNEPKLISENTQVVKFTCNRK